MRTILCIITFLFLTCISRSQEIPSEKKLDSSENNRIVMLIKVASIKYDSLVQYQRFIDYAENRKAEIKNEITSIFSQAEIEMLKILGRYGFNPDIFTLQVRTNEKGEAELHVVKKSDLPNNESPSRDSKNIE